ncbi:hypothetical protein GCM10008014_45390 [Paenibacillus silvae]|uniref:Uncharacterized protein n=1 Tax=Paenibacillus silvae TaxID=1325358 RepID=A0ABQ1ZGP7_9BACL|nr:hypothetical protein [Paenibacillus silvae]GGH65727.1 hypothetical protein GCM10008014_45390 [Paenibacillus silvae]
MKRTRFSIIIHPFISIFIISIVIAGVLFFTETNLTGDSPINYSEQDNFLIFIVTTLWLYFTFVVSLGITSLLMEFFEVKQILRAIIYVAIAIICMFLPTVLKEYNWSFIVVTIAFYIIEILCMKRTTNKD